MTAAALAGAPLATRRYYTAFANRHGFSDDRMRGHGHDLVRFKPLGLVDDANNAGKFCLERRPVNGGVRTLRDRQLDAEAWYVGRQRKAEALLEALGSLVVEVRDRIDARPTCAARDALRDADIFLDGYQPAACGGDRSEVLGSLVRILSRYA